MKQRITYLLLEGHHTEGPDIQVGTDHLNFTRASEAAKEWRFTLGWTELPVEVRDILADCHELHLRWSSTRRFELRSPLVARLSAGLHAFFTPRGDDHDVPVCDLIRKSLDDEAVKCDSVSQTWTKPPILSERFAAASTYQYFQFSRSSQRLGDAFLEQLCKGKSPGLHDCRGVLDELSSADYIDVDFDAISHAVILSAYWEASNANDPKRKLSDTITKSTETDIIEVGVLQPETAKEPEQISLGGHLTVVGESDHPSVTLFSFPARHHSLSASSPATFNANFQFPTGLHPHFTLTFPDCHHLIPPKATCALHAYWTLPSALFLDRYQLSDPLFLAASNLARLHSLAGEDDLEAPDWVVGRWGSAALVELVPPPPYMTNHSVAAGAAATWTVTIPAHLRYIASSPNTPTGHVEVEVPWPTVFWACDAEEGLKMATNPFDRVNLGFEGLFGGKTMFYHVPPSMEAGALYETVKVPVLGVQGAGWVEVGTLGVVLVGFAWVCGSLFWGSWGRRGREGEREKKRV